MSIPTFLTVVLLFTEILLSVCRGAVVVRDDRFTQEGYYDRSVEVNVCGELGEDETSDTYCSCKVDVISCEFSKFSTSDKPVHMNLASSWETDLVKRVCICGAPRNLEVLFSSTFIRDHHSVHRVDIYNMEGPITIAAAFDVYFSGDLFIANVKYLREIIPWGFGRGVRMNLVDTEGLECCSKISGPKLSSPALFVEDTTIGTVRNSAINGQHLWRSIVFNGVVFNEIEEYGISLESTDELSLNISFTNCEFNNLGQNSISVTRFTNILIMNSVIHETCHEASIDTRSSVRSSTLAWVGNDFRRSQTLQLDAKTVLIGFNKFQSWDNQTFASLIVTTHNDRKIFVEYNSAVDAILPSQPSIGANKTIFNENLMSYCKCSNPFLANISESPLSNSTNRCEVRNVTHHCHLSLEIARSECSKAKSPGFLKHCDHVLTVHENYPADTQRLVDFESEFLNQMVASYAMAPFPLPELKDEIQETENEEMNTATPGEVVGDADDRNNKTAIANLINRLISDSLLIVAYYFS